MAKRLKVKLSSTVPQQAEPSRRFPSYFNSSLGHSVRPSIRWEAKRKDFDEFNNAWQAACSKAREHGHGSVVPHELESHWKDAWACDLFRLFSIPDPDPSSPEAIAEFIDDVSTILKAAEFCEEEKLFEVAPYRLRVYELPFPHTKPFFPAINELPEGWLSNALTQPNRTPFFHSLDQLEEMNRRLWDKTDRTCVRCDLPEVMFDDLFHGLSFLLNHTNNLPKTPIRRSPKKVSIAPLKRTDGDWDWLSRLTYTTDEDSPAWTVPPHEECLRRISAKAIPRLSRRLDLKYDPLITLPTTSFKHLVGLIDNWCIQVREQTKNERKNKGGRPRDDYTDPQLLAIKIQDEQPGLTWRQVFKEVKSTYPTISYDHIHEGLDRERKRRKRPGKKEG